MIVYQLSLLFSVYVLTMVVMNIITMAAWSLSEYHYVMAPV